MTIKIYIDITDDQGNELDLDEVMKALRAIKKVQTDEKKSTAKKIEVRDIPTPYPSSTGFIQAWLDFIDMREEIKSPLTPTGARALLKKLKEMGHCRAVEALTHSTANQYKGVWEPKDNNMAPMPQPKGPSKITASDARFRLIKEYKVSAARDWSDEKCLEEFFKRKKG